MRLIPHICAHIFYVHIYVTISSLLALLALHIRFFLNLSVFQRMEHDYVKTSDTERQTLSTPNQVVSPRILDCEDKLQDSEESLLLLLRQAQAAKQA